MTTRTDAHRPSTLVPAHYSSRVDYSLPSARSGFAIPAIGVDCATPYAVYHPVTGRYVETRIPTCPDTGRCCVASAERQVRRDQVFGCAGRCGVCGARFTYGTLFRHESGPRREVPRKQARSRKVSRVLDESTLPQT